MPLALRVLRGVPEEGRLFPLPVGKWMRLGRYGPEQGVEVQLTSVGVMRNHAEVWRDDVGVWVEDLDSANGTWLNSKRLASRRKTLVRACDWLHLARAGVRLVLAGPADPAWLAWGDRIIVRLAQGIRERRGDGFSL